MAQSHLDYLESIIAQTDDDDFMPDDAQCRLAWYAQKMISIRQTARAAAQHITKENLKCPS